VIEITQLRTSCRRHRWPTSRDLDLDDDDDSKVQGRLCRRLRLAVSIGQNPLHQFPSSKSVTSGRGQKSVVSVVLCRFPSWQQVCCVVVMEFYSITTTQQTCCQLVTDLLATSQIILTCQDSLPCRCNKSVTSWHKLATSPSMGKLLENVSN